MMKKFLVCIICICTLFTNTSFNVYANTNDEEIVEYDTEFNLGENGGYLAANFLGTKNIYEQRRFTWGTGAKGFAAEQANNLSDVINGKNAKIVGNDNLKNGPDRRIINRDGSVTFIQDKYYSTAKGSVEAGFDEVTGVYKYVDADGKPMQLEVPKGQGKEAIEIMEQKIKDGYVDGVTDPNEAQNIIREGQYTFKQAENIAKAGNIDSLVYDAKSGAIVSLSAMGVSFVLDFASCMINGDDWKEALKNSSLNSLKVGTGVEIVYIISSQLARTNAPIIFKPAADKLAQILGPKASKALVELLGEEGQVVTEKAVSGIIQNNLLVQAVTIVVFTVPDVVDLFKGRISSKQLAINLAILIGGSAGATIGMVAGSSVGGPLGSFLGGLSGGVIGTYGASTLLTTFFETDTDEMYNIITSQFSEISENYLVSQDEADLITKTLSEKLTTKILKDMYESDDREKFANELILDVFESQIKNRKKVEMPTQEDVRRQMISVMDGMVFIH